MVEKYFKGVFRVFLFVKIFLPYKLSEPLKLQKEMMSAIDCKLFESEAVRHSLLIILKVIYISSFDYYFN